MRIVRTAFAACLAAAVFSCLLGACSTGEEQSSQPASPSGKKSLIRFVASEYSTETKPVLEKLVSQFMFLNPDIDVELQVVNWDILDGIYTMMISSGDPPDLLNTNVYAHFAKDGLLNDMDAILSPELKAKFYPNMAEIDRYNGIQYAIPYVATTRKLYYNKDLFADAGITKSPATWSELEADAAAITAKGKAYGFGLDLTDNETQAYLSYVFLGSGGGWMNNGKWTINSPENVEGLAFFKKLFDEGLTDPEPTVTTRDEKQRVLGDGKLGMMISGNYFTSVVPREFPGLKWGMGPIPVKDGQPPISFGVHDVLVSFKTNHTDKEALGKFLDFLYNDANYEEMVLREGFLPVTRTVGDQMSAADEVMASNLDALMKASFYPVQQPEWQAVLDRARKLGTPSCMTA
ncbi:ABC transporter substrate-binding protein [Paenibacillus protaetiae]|uniref:Extracellular solute-binding protein n=1 Tax=Paenibacillus protaetiae TaxID=2509456 RepID=A0A4P6EQF8_9BACL|nr:extracellular solute-binding protein [Paenibacillus protaetiae]QAY65062.1 extracellular solute-binding protein [Paenibacillus protaetiae]